MRALPIHLALLFLLGPPLSATAYTGYGAPFAGQDGISLAMGIPDHDDFLLQGVEVTLDLAYLPDASVQDDGTGDLYITLSHGGTTVPLVDLRGATDGSHASTASPAAHLDGRYTLSDDASTPLIAALLTTGTTEAPDGAYLPAGALGAGGFAGHRADDLWTLRASGAEGWDGFIRTWSLRLIPEDPTAVPEPPSILLLCTAAGALLGWRRSRHRAP